EHCLEPLMPHGDCGCDGRQQTHSRVEQPYQKDQANKPVSPRFTSLLVVAVDVPHFSASERDAG
ncbi:MAG: hypothetical protein ACXVGG_15400, partial [Mycobacteriaceae bacterium]